MMGMIVILCDSFRDANEAYDIFVSVLERNEPWNIRKSYNESLCIETEEDLRYIFVDWRMKEVFKNVTPDFLDEEEFFEDLEKYFEV